MYRTEYMDLLHYKAQRHAVSMSMSCIIVRKSVPPALPPARIMLLLSIIIRVRVLRVRSSEVHLVLIEEWPDLLEEVLLPLQRQTQGRLDRRQGLRHLLGGGLQQRKPLLRLVAANPHVHHTRLRCLKSAIVQ